MVRRLLPWALSIALLVGLTTAAWGAKSATTGPIVITCQRCEPSTTDVFSQSRYDVAQAFNRKYKGKYQVKVEHFGGANQDDLQYWERLLLANRLPDIFVAQTTQLQALSKTGKLLNMASYLAKDKTWKNSFYAGSFDSLKGPKGQIWGIAEQRDVVGIFYNKMLFAKAGVTTFPRTWTEFRAASKKLKDSGVIPFATDGDWVTLLMWANLVGTQPGGESFLYSGIRKGNYANNAIVVKATNFLKGLHTDGYVNQDAFSGDYQNAAKPFTQGQAAMIANGPWMVNADIKQTTSSPNLYSKIGYAASPGWTSNGRGVIVLAGAAGWASGTKDPAKREAVIEFIKFTTQPGIQLQRTAATGAYWPVKIRLTPKQIKKLEPLSYGLVSSADKAKYHYAHAKFATPSAFSDAWKNYWPAYVQGAMDTKAFLTKLSDAVTTAGP